MTAPALVMLALRIVLVILFLPFSALDKTLNFAGAVQQAKQITSSDTLARGLILVGLAVEVFMSLGIVTGVADRAAAFVLGGYCAVTALLFKQFWKPGDFWHKGQSKARDLFWDFLKNFSLAAGIMLVTFGTTASDVPRFFDAPFSSTHPYRAGNLMTDSGPTPKIPYWHLWTDDSGISHQVKCELDAWELKGVGGADPQWNDKQERVDSTVVFTVQPVGWLGDWHENPAPQWIVVLSGAWWVESMDGTRVDMAAGEFSLGEDQGTTPTGGKKGHRSGTIGEQPAVLMTVQLHRDPIKTPCHTA